MTRGVRDRAPGVLLLLSTLLVAACNPTPSETPPAGTLAPTDAATLPSASPTVDVGETPAASLDRVTGWRSDLAALIPGMAGIHPSLYHGVSEQALADAVAAASASAATATDDQLLDSVLRIVAMVSAGGCDAHTGAYLWGTGTYPLDTLPLRLWLFGEQLVIVDALPPYQRLIGSTILTIEDRPTTDVLAALDPLIPRDNEQTVRLLTPRFLQIPQVLRGLGLADEGPIRLRYRLGSGVDPFMVVPEDIDVMPIPMASYNAWAGPYGLHLPADPDVLYLSRIDDALWWQRLSDGSTLYVQYNRVDPLPASQVADLGTAMRDPTVSTVILDLRHNYGGETSALDPIVALFQDPTFDEAGRLFVATGRNTFSAGSLLVARLQRETKAQVVGEAMGGCPTFWSDSAPLDLPWSGIQVSVSENVAVGVDPNDTRHGILPDTTLELTLDEWLAGDDPVIDAFVGIGP